MAKITRSKMRYEVLKQLGETKKLSNKNLAKIIKLASTDSYEGYSDKTVVKLYYYKIKNLKVNFLGKKVSKKENFIISNDFLQSYQWRKIRYDVLNINNGKCELCGRSKKDGIILHVDHIKPRLSYPDLALEISNLQVLCNECNHGKGNRDMTDWRK